MHRAILIDLSVVRGKSIPWRPDGMVWYGQDPHSSGKKLMVETAEPTVSNAMKATQ